MLCPPAKILLKCGFGLVEILSLTHFLTPYLNMFNLVSFLRFTSSLLKIVAPLYIKPSLAMLSLHLGGINKPAPCLVSVASSLPLNFVAM